jgi:hypothetical protein
VAEKAGLSSRQKNTALRVANVPTAEDQEVSYQNGYIPCAHQASEIGGQGDSPHARLIFPIGVVQVGGPFQRKPGHHSRGDDDANDATVNTHDDSEK